MNDSDRPADPGVSGGATSPCAGLLAGYVVGLSLFLCDGSVWRGTFWSPVPPRTVAVVGFPRADEQSVAVARRDRVALAGTSCTRLHAIPA
ncbi:MAG TPA: hypothetical protein VF836_12225 [Gemmatimonadaceae bacterium]